MELLYLLISSGEVTVSYEPCLNTARWVGRWWWCSASS